MLVTPAEIIVDLLERADEVHDDDENDDDDEDDDDDDDDDDNDDDDNDDDDDDEDDEDDEDDDNDDDDVFIAIRAPGEAYPPPRPSGWTLVAPLDRLQGKLVTHLDRRGGRLSPPSTIGCRTALSTAALCGWMPQGSTPASLWRRKHRVQLLHPGSSRQAKS